MAQTYDYVSERRLLYFTQKLKQHFPTAADFIDDTVAAIDKVWSSQKISDELNGKVGLDTVVAAKCPKCGYETVTTFRFGPEFWNPSFDD